MSALEPLIPFALMFMVLYFLIIRPQVQEKKEHDDLVAGLAKDDRVVTASGIHGRVLEVGEATLKLELGGKAWMNLDKSAVARKLDASTTAKG